MFNSKKYYIIQFFIELIFKTIKDGTTMTILKKTLEASGNKNLMCRIRDFTRSYYKNHYHFKMKADYQIGKRNDSLPDISFSQVGKKRYLF